MVNYREIQQQLARIGYKMPFWQQAEVKELCKALAEGEDIVQAVNGHYEGGFGLLVATTNRLLLVDRKPMFLTLDAISYGMIQEISLNYRLLNSTIHIWTSNKCLDFSSWNHNRVRELLDYAQKCVIASRNHMHTDMMGNQIPVLQSEAPQYYVEPQINYKGAYTNAYVPVQAPSQFLRTEPLPVAPSDLSTGSTKVYAAGPLATRAYARRYF